ncbi:MAG: F0F1 ATP synthase subunit delta [Candidatus Gastranaerophilales bacterium]|nr:F0F1 ATP synthase subunit delta [Candidatus Gastranaerophilales bacterium]
MSNGNNIGLSTIADRYANALIELGEKCEQLDIYNTDLGLILATFASHKDLNRFLEHPTIPIGDKKEIIENIFKGAVSPNILNTLKLLLDRNRIFIFPSIVYHYTEILNKKRNIAIAEVFTAIEIDEEIKIRVKNQLEKLFNKTINLEHKIQPDIIAGMVVKVGDRVIDGSIKARLENMKKQMI